MSIIQQDAFFSIVYLNSHNDLIEILAIKLEDVILGVENLSQTNLTVFISEYT